MKYDISELKQILYLESKKYYEQKDKLQILNSDLSLYNVLLEYLSNNVMENINEIDLLLDTLCKNKRVCQMFTQLIAYIERSNDSDKLEKIAHKQTQIFELVKNDMEKLSVEVKQIVNYLKNNSQNIYKYKTITAMLKNGQVISDEDIEFLFKTLGNLSYSFEEQIRFIESVKKHNVKARAKFAGVSREYKDGVIEMLNFGFEIIKDDSLDYTKNAQDVADMQYEQLEYYDDIDEFLSVTFKMCKTENEYKLVLLLLIKKIQNNILEQIQLIKEKDFYVDKELKEDILHEYNRQLYYYKKLYNAYSNLCIKDEEVVMENKNDLIFSRNGNGKCYFLHDLEKVNKEYLSTVKKLIDNLLSGNITKNQIEGFDCDYGEFRKLKRDQVRILIKQQGKDLYAVIGAFVKKEQSGDADYKRLSTRSIPKINNPYELEQELKYSDEVLNSFEQFVNENARIGNR